MRPTKALQRLDEMHSLVVELTEQNQGSAVIRTIASVLSQVPALDKAVNDAPYWQLVIVNLNTLADTLQGEELAGDSLFDGDLTDEDWELADLLLDDEGDGY